MKWDNPSHREGWAFRSLSRFKESRGYKKPGLCKNAFLSYSLPPFGVVEASPRNGYARHSGNKFPLCPRLNAIFPYLRGRVLNVWHSSTSPKIGEVAAKQTEEYEKRHFYTAPVSCQRLNPPAPFRQSDGLRQPLCQSRKGHSGCRPRYCGKSRYCIGCRT